MNRWLPSLCGIVVISLAACGGGRPAPEPEEALDPYLPEMSVRINAVIYSERPTGEMLEELALLGIVPNTSFEDFKHESGIGDWFAAEEDLIGTRQTSLTCGLSPVVDPAGRMIELHRSRKRVDGKVWEELRLTP
jgi:hypothetical protein